MFLPITRLPTWKKPIRIENIKTNKKFHEKSKYVNDMLTTEETHYHKKSDFGCNCVFESIP